MKARVFIIVPLLGVLLVVTAGCERKKPEPAPASPTRKLEKSPGTNALPAAPKTPSATSATVRSSIPLPNTKVPSEAVPAADSTAQAQSLIELARKMVTESKWREAAGAINQLSGLPLTQSQTDALSALHRDLKRMISESEAKEALLRKQPLGP